MEEKEFWLMITDFDTTEENVSFVVKESRIKTVHENHRIRFFHQRFQSKNGTLSRILKEEKDKEILIVFHKNVPRKKISKIIDHIKEVNKDKICAFSTSLVF